MRLLYSYLRPFGWLVTLALVLAAINQVFSMLDPFIFSKVVDNYANKANEFTRQQFITGVLTLLGLTMGAAMVSRIAKNFQDYFMNVIIQRMGARIYQDGLRHSLSLPFATFEDQRSGQTLGILQKVRTDSERLIQVFVNILFPSIVGIVFIAFYSFSIHWAIAPVYFAAVPIIGYISSQLSKRIKTVQKNIIGQTTSLAGATTESLRNIELIKSLGLARQEEQRLNGITDQILKLELKKVRYVRSLSFIQGTIINFLRTTILFIMLMLIFGNELQVGQLFALLIYSFFIFGPLQELGTIITVYRETQISLENFNNLLNTAPEHMPQHPVSTGRLENLSFDHVGFKHLTASRHALQDISFQVKAGQTIAFAGPSGSGKSTLVKLLVGLYHPLEGDIYYNGIRQKNIDLNALRHTIGFVTQDTQLFSGPIKENLLFANPSASEEDVYEALKKAACGSILERSAEGIDTMIGEGGMKLSGGERQRLAIARALVRKPQLLIFDEATSALDSLTEEEISATIRDISASGEHITILIAHRLSTVMHADRIIVLERGEITEAGQHHELVEAKGLYYAMWRQQIGERREREDKPEPVGVGV